MGRLAIALLCSLGCHGLFLFLPFADPEIIVPQLPEKTSITIHLAAAVAARAEPVPRQSQHHTIKQAADPLLIRPEHKKKVRAKPRAEKFIPHQPEHTSPPAAASPLLQQLKDNSGSRVPALVKATPLYQSNPKPMYPFFARRRGQQGTVMLQVMVSEKGRVEQVTLFKSSGFALLDSAALTAVQDWQFIPGTVNDRAVTTEVLIPVHFMLQ